MQDTKKNIKKGLSELSLIEKKVIIIIATCNQERLLVDCLKSLKKTKYNNYKIFLVDDSGKEIGKNIKKEFNVDLITTNGYTGQSKVWNLAIKKALKEDFDYVFLLDDDTKILDENWLVKLIKVGESDEKIGILGCKVIHPNGRIQWMKKDTGKVPLIKEVDNVIGCCFLMKKKVIDEIGFFDEKFSPAYGEESDFCFRALKKGFRCIYVGTTKIMHYGGTTTKKIFNEKVWFFKKRHAIRMEWLNFSFLKIMKYSFIHLGSAILSNKPIKKLKFLRKAYLENIKDFKEIKMKRKERNGWLKK